MVQLYWRKMIYVYKVYLLFLWLARTKSAKIKLSLCGRFHRKSLSIKLNHYAYVDPKPRDCVSDKNKIQGSIDRFIYLDIRGTTEHLG